ncbi:hypothetical protein DENSPDRAFT_192443 [Dentipellis sp. KUC8613]|nr:hypothetical protein DENSPDRAFT_192443 [Dentipellis sp. KUC8613]
MLCSVALCGLQVASCGLQVAPSSAAATAACEAIFALVMLTSTLTLTLTLTLTARTWTWSCARAVRTYDPLLLPSCDYSRTRRTRRSEARRGEGLLCSPLRVNAGPQTPRCELECVDLRILTSSAHAMYVACRVDCYLLPAT